MSLNSQSEEPESEILSGVSDNESRDAVMLEPDTPDTQEEDDEHPSIDHALAVPNQGPLHGQSDMKDAMEDPDAPIPEVFLEMEAEHHEEMVVEEVTAALHRGDDDEDDHFAEGGEVAEAGSYEEENVEWDEESEAKSHDAGPVTLEIEDPDKPKAAVDKAGNKVTRSSRERPVLASSGEARPTRFTNAGPPQAPQPPRFYVAAPVSTFQDDDGRHYDQYGRLIDLNAPKMTYRCVTARPLFEAKRDRHGNPVLNSNGREIMVPEVDEDGRWIQCGALQEKRPFEPWICEKCGGRILEKLRTKHMVQFQAN
jgi:DNA-directed RNA polymerase subunit RPC12/RpoP